jgi:hypothetical protein
LEALVSISFCVKVRLFLKKESGVILIMAITIGCDVSIKLSLRAISLLYVALYILKRRILDAKLGKKSGLK